MNAGTTLTKTDKGRREMAERSGTLSAVQRRLLILVDGKKTVNDLGAFVRVGELTGALYHLQDLGLVAPTGELAALQPPAGPGFAASGPVELERPATSPREFTRVRDEAWRFVQERLGPAGAPIRAAIELHQPPRVAFDAARHRGVCRPATGPANDPGVRAPLWHPAFVAARRPRARLCAYCSRCKVLFSLARRQPGAFSALRPIHHRSHTP